MASFTANQDQIEIEFQIAATVLRPTSIAATVGYSIDGDEWRLSPCLDLWKQYDSCW